MDKLEDFIRNNRKELDIYSPPPSVWKNIRSNLGRKRYAFYKWSAAAAALVIVFITAAFLYKYRAGNVPAFGKDPGLISIKGNKRLLETELYYNNLANDLFNKAEPLLTGHPDIREELFLDLSQIDSLCRDIKQDLNDNIDNQEVIEALINNYRIRIEILQNMLETLRKENNAVTNDESYEL